MGRTGTALKYFDFNANGLKIIGNRAFNQVRNLTEVNEIGGTIVSIGNMAFVRAFGARDDNINLQIGGNITYFDVQALATQREFSQSGHTMSITIGSPENRINVNTFN